MKVDRNAKKSLQKVLSQCRTDPCLYNLLATLLVWPICILVRRHPNFEDTLQLRLSFKLPARPHGELLWFHGSSLGEVKAVAGLLTELKAPAAGHHHRRFHNDRHGREAAGSIAASI